MLCPTPVSPLFPYTTLFRSDQGEGGGRPHATPERAEPVRHPSLGLGSRLPLEQVSAAEPHPDRKSTRLNSSHLVISYDVFCLKKKKDRNSITPTNQKV